MRSLQDQISGVVLTPDAPAYDQARTVWNAMVDRKPRLIVRCADPADVAAAIRYAREQELEIGVRCGGHSVVGHAIPADGLVIDLAMLTTYRSTRSGAGQGCGAARCWAPWTAPASRTG